jgi:hypothetical protein
LISIFSKCYCQIHDDTLLIKRNIPDERLQKEAISITSKEAFKMKYDSIRAFADSFILLQNNTPPKTLIHKRIKGIVRDANTNEGVPFSQLVFRSSGIGAIAEVDGSFEIQFQQTPSNSLLIKALGYKPIERVIDTTLFEQYIEFEVSRSDNVLRTVVVRAGEDPAIVLMKRVIKTKDQNNLNRFSNYQYELYNKMELDLVRMTKEQFKKIPMMKPFAFIFDNVDSLSESKPFLPIYLTESLSDYYYQKDPSRKKEVIKATETKGVNNESVSQFLGGMYQQINVYDNYIEIFGKQFISPISNGALNYYKYQIADTQNAYGHQLILVQFEPKREAENCFYGDLWIVDSVLAIQRVSMDISKNANINLVNRVSIYQEFIPVQDTIWFNVKDKFIADFTVPYGGKKMPGFIGRKSTSYKNIMVNDNKISDYIADKNNKPNIKILEGASNKGATFWAQARHDSLNKNEKAIYAMIDTLNAMPIFNTTKNVITFLGKGTQEWGYFEFGPYWNIYNNNPVEGHRFRYSMGTTTKLFKDLYLNGYVAYGTKDERFKYKLAGLWLLNRHPRERIYASYTHDLDRSISYYSEAATDNFLSNMVRKRYLPYKVAFVKDFRLEHYKEYYNGFSHEVSVLHKQFDPYNPLPGYWIFKDKEGNNTNLVTNSEVGIKIRFAHNEKFLEGDYHRFSLGSKYPIVSLRLALGIKGILNSAYNYQKLTLNISDVLSIPHLGTFTYNIFAGKHFGTLPYPLLEVHPGNDYYYYNSYAFSMMNRFEFLSDTYAGFMLEHNIGGGIFNYIPLVKKTKIRQFWTLKTAIGSLSDANKSLNLNNGFEFKTLQSSPYVEIGTGIDNIFQLFRIDFVWRVAPTPLLNEPLENRFGIFGSFRVAF